jgi:hypothetical protein
MNIIQVLTTQRKGKFVNEASDKLAALVKQCRATSRAGALMITLKVKPAMNGEVFVTDACDCKQPKPEVSATLFYDDQDGNLQREDPAQESLPFATMNEEAANQ